MEKLKSWPPCHTKEVNVFWSGSKKYCIHRQSHCAERFYSKSCKLIRGKLKGCQIMLSFIKYWLPGKKKKNQTLREREDTFVLIALCFYHILATLNINFLHRCNWSGKRERTTRVHIGLGRNYSKPKKEVISECNFCLCQSGRQCNIKVPLVHTGAFVELGNETYDCDKQS